MSTAPIWLLYSSEVDTEENLGAWLDQNQETLDDWNKKMIDE
jgi:hypothetical protein